MEAGSIWARSRRASAQAWSEVSRAMTWRRMPNPMVLPSAAAPAVTRSTRSATMDGGSPQVR